MRSVPIVIIDVGVYHPKKVSLTEYQQLIQTLAPHGTDEPFADGVGFGGADRGPQDFHLGSDGNRGNRLPIFLIVIADERLGALLEQRGFAAGLPKHQSEVA
jgi:hypothetical protein